MNVSSGYWTLKMKKFGHLDLIVKSKRQIGQSGEQLNTDIKSYWIKSYDS